MVRISIKFLIEKKLVLLFPSSSLRFLVHKKFTSTFISNDILIFFFICLSSGRHQPYLLSNLQISVNFRCIFTTNTTCLPAPFIWKSCSLFPTYFHDFQHCMFVAKVELTSWFQQNNFLFYGIFLSFVADYACSLKECRFKLLRNCLGRGCIFFMVIITQLTDESLFKFGFFK